MANCAQSRLARGLRRALEPVAFEASLEFVAGRVISHRLFRRVVTSVEEIERPPIVVEERSGQPHARLDFSATVNLPQLKCDAPIDAVVVEAHDRRDERRAPLELDL